MEISESRSEYQDFALETYRHASRYGDSPCDFAFLPRRGIFFWPMEKSELDKRRFCLWARMLKRMEKDKILISVEEGSASTDFRDARYFFHRSQFRQPYYKSHKIHWPHVKEWYFEYMNGEEETPLLKHAMDNLEAYLDSRDGKEDVKAFNPFPLSETKSKTINVPLIKRKDEIQICKDPSYSNRYKHQNIAQASKAQENLKAFEPPLNQIPTLIDSRHDNTLLDPLVTSKNHQICKPCPATQVNEKRVSIKLNGRNGRLMTCSGCPRCNFRVQFPDDLFEGKILQYEDLLPTKVGCEYVICQECIKVYNFPEANTIKEHLKSPEHTRNVLLRLHKAGVKPTETTETKHRVINLDSYAKLHGFASVKDYITKDPLLPPEISKPLPLLTNGPCRIVNPSLNQLPASGGTNTLNEYEVKTPEYRSPDKQSLSSKAPEDEDETIYVNDKIEYHNSSVHNLSQIGNVHQKLNLLYIQQRKTSELLDMVEGDLSKVQDSIKEISCKVQNCSDQTESLTEICLRHDNAIKILQKEAIDGKNFSNIMDGQIDGMMGVTTREALSSRLEKQDKELTSLRLELKNKVEDVNYWLKVIDRHTNDIHLLKQNAWINGQMQNPEESYRTLTQKLEYQIQINEQTTRNCMLQMENRFDAVTRQYADEINFLRQMDEEKKLQILNLKAQLGLKFAHMEQKQSSLRKARKYL